MAPGGAIRVPTTACLPSSLRASSSTRTLIKSLARFSRAVLIEIALEWLCDENQPLCEPYLVGNRATHEREEEDYAYPPVNNIQELREVYLQLKDQTGTKRDIIDRILDGDWRRGLSIYQMALLDVHYLQKHDSALRWTALKLVSINTAAHNRASNEVIPLSAKGAKGHSLPTSAPCPSVHATTFLQNLQHEIAPVVKAHYHLRRVAARSLTILRIYVTDSPYANLRHGSGTSFADASRTLFIAFPDSCPFVYVSINGLSVSTKSADTFSLVGTYDAVALKRIVLEAVPKALSRPHRRYGLISTSLGAKSLSTMLSLRGHGKQGASNGAYSIFAEGSVDESPLNPSSRAQPSKDYVGMGQNDDTVIEQARSPRYDTARGSKRKQPLQELSNNLQTQEYISNKRQKMAAAKRFGTAETLPSESKGIDRCHIKFTDPLVSENGQEPKERAHVEDEGFRIGHVSIVFHGSDIFSGIRRLVETGLVVEEKMPRWMTGELGVSSGVVSEGRLFNHKGGGA